VPIHNTHVCDYLYGCERPLVACVKFPKKRKIEFSKLEKLKRQCCSQPIRTKKHFPNTEWHSVLEIENRICSEMKNCKQPTHLSIFCLSGGYINEWQRWTNVNNHFMDLWNAQGGPKSMNGIVCGWKLSKARRHQSPIVWKAFPQTFVLKYQPVPHFSVS
jgi:hypothetical protein